MNKICYNIYPTLNNHIWLSFYWCGMTKVLQTYRSDQGHGRGCKGMPGDGSGDKPVFTPECEPLARVIPYHTD